MKLHTAVALLTVIEVAALGVYFCLCIANKLEDNFWNSQVINYNYNTSVFDVMVFDLVRCILVSIMYSCYKLLSVKAIGLIAWVSTILVGGKLALLVLVVLQVGSDFPPTTVGIPRLVFLGGVILFGWIDFFVMILVNSHNRRQEALEAIRDGPESALILPATSIASDPFGKARSAGPRAATKRSNENTALLINSEAPEVEVMNATPKAERLSKPRTDLSPADPHVDVLSPAVLQNTKASKSILSMNSATDNSAPISVGSSRRDEADSSVFIMPSIPRLAALMIDERKGIPLKDRSGIFKTYKKCFTGKEAIDWLCYRMNGTVTRANARLVLQSMTDKGYLSCITRTDTKFVDEEGEYYVFEDLSQLEVALLKDSNPSALPRALSAHSARPPLPVEVQELVDAMRLKKTGVPVKDRKLASATNTKDAQLHPRCFLGTEAMEWLQAPGTRTGLGAKWAASVQEAKAILNFLRRADVIYDITLDRDHSFSESRFYRFRDDDAALPVYLQQSPSASPYNIDYNALTGVVKILSMNTPAETGISFSPTDNHNGKAAQSATGPVAASPSKSSTAMSQSMRNFLTQMRAPGSGITTKPRKLPPSNKKVPAFSGADAIDWLIKAKSLSDRDHAVKILNKILVSTEDAIKPLEPNKKGGSEVADSKKVYYYFVEEESAPESAASPSSTSSPVAIAPKANGHSATGPNGSLPSSSLESRSFNDRPSHSDQNGSRSGSSFKGGVGPLLLNFIAEMKDPSKGLPLKDATITMSSHESTTYHNCFTGADAVSWLTEKMQLSARDQAAKILQRILTNKTIVSVQSPDQSFVDSAAALFKFAD